MKLVAKGLFLLIACGATLAHAQSFQHIMILFQENRTPDNLFQALCGPSRQLCPNPYNLRNYGIDKSGNHVPLVYVPLAVYYDPDHSHNGFEAMCDLDPTTNTCRMDGLQTTGCFQGSHGSCWYAQVIAGDVAPYLTIATQYGWANYMFSTHQGPTEPGHQIIFSGTSSFNASADAAAMFISENGSATASGCLAPQGDEYWGMSPSTAPRGYPIFNQLLGTICVSHDTMATLLDNHQPPISWKYYGYGEDQIGTAPNWIRPLCQPDSTYQHCTGQEFISNVDLYPPDVLTDIGNCNLAAMNWVIPRGQDSDHPGGPYSGGPSWIASIINAIGESQCKNPDGTSYWNTTAIFVTWDDWGGWYDHEPPTLLSVPSQGQGDYQYGFRVPLLVVSAYTPKGYVDNLRYDFGSIHRFIEQNFGIPEGALHFADARATNDLTTFFNWNQQPRKFQHISAPLDGNFFINDKSPVEPLDSY
jgi:phospholipase C